VIAALLLVALLSTRVAGEDIVALVVATYFFTFTRHREKNEKKKKKKKKEKKSFFFSHFSFEYVCVPSCVMMLVGLSASTVQHAAEHRLHRRGSEGAGRPHGGRLHQHDQLAAARRR
jgi:uncharacterized membrane protein YkvI